MDRSKLVTRIQITRRSVGRVVLRRELWNGNRERWRNLFSLDPMESVIRWSWTQHDRYVNRYAAAMVDPRWSHLRFERVRTRADIRSLYAEAEASSSATSAKS
jgi:hypothetical protein